MSGVAGRSGRQAGDDLTEDEVSALFDGADTNTAAGCRLVLVRADKLSLRGMLPSHRHKLLIASMTAQLRVILDAEFEARERRITEKLERIEALRTGAGTRAAARAAGPPPGSLAADLATKDKPTE